MGSNGVSLVMAYDASGQLLLGKRRDTGKWTLPGGGLDLGETPEEGAKRELYEETGLKPTSLTKLTTTQNTHGTIHFFTAYVTGTPHSDNDPDQEVASEDWKFFDLSNGMPKAFNNLSGPDDDTNMIRQVLKSECSLHKSQEDNEVDTLLAHPNPIERLMALKLNSVKHHHLQTAVLDPDPQVHTAAMDHHNFDHHAGMWLMESKEDAVGSPPTAQQRKFLTHPVLNEHHLASALSNADGRLDPELVDHPMMTPELIYEMFNKPQTSMDHRCKLLQHPNASEDLLSSVVRSGIVIPSEDSQRLARAAIESPHCTLPVSSDLIRSATDPRAPDHVYKLALHTLAHARVPLNVITDLFTQAKLYPDARHSALCVAATMGPNATKAHLEQVTSKLTKSIAPEHLQHFHHEIAPDGAKLVDHKPDLNAHPAVNRPAVEAYRKTVLNSPHIAKPHKPAEAIGSDNTGRSPKAVFSAQVPGQESSSKFLVKPYHEFIDPDLTAMQSNPHQGWSEMTNQALFHAGGIGHLHQQVHVDEHNMGVGHEKEPATVIHLAPGYSTVSDSGHDRNSYKTSDENKLNLRKIGLMSFLANAQDQHAANFMIHNETGAPLAIDNSRNFAYVRSHIRGNPREGENIGNYITHSAIGHLEPVIGPGTSVSDALKGTADRYKPAFDWWKGAAPQIKQTFHDRLSQIKDPAVKEHLARNFDARASVLDNYAEQGIHKTPTWFNKKVPHYKLGEVSEAEKFNPEVVSRANALVPAKRVLDPGEGKANAARWLAGLDQTGDPRDGIADTLGTPPALRAAK